MFPLAAPGNELRQERFPSFNRRDPKPQRRTPFCCLAWSHDVQFASAQQIADTACHEAISAAWRVIIDEYSAAAAIAPEGFGRDVKLHEQLRRKVARQKTVRETFQ